MLAAMQDIIEEMDDLPKYFQERAAAKMQDVLREVAIEMLLTEYESRTAYEGKPWVPRSERGRKSRKKKHGALVE
jgi:hypothetical protein